MDTDRSRRELTRFEALDPDRASIQRHDDRLLEAFVVDLIQSRGMREKAAKEHAGRVADFARRYLIDIEGVALSEAEGSDIEDYLGNWYPKHVPDGDRKDVRKILGSLEKFYRYLHEIGEIDREVLRGIVETCQDRHRLLG